MKSCLFVSVAVLVVFSFSTTQVFAKKPTAKKVLVHQKTVTEICQPWGGLQNLSGGNSDAELGRLKSKLKDEKFKKATDTSDQEIAKLSANSVTIMADLIDPLIEKKNFLLVQELTCSLGWYLALAERECVIKEAQKRIDDAKEKPFKFCDCVTSTLMGQNYCGF